MQAQFKIRHTWEVVPDESVQLFAAANKAMTAASPEGFKSAAQIFEKAAENCRKAEEELRKYLELSRAMTPKAITITIPEGFFETAKSIVDQVLGGRA